MIINLINITIKVNCLWRIKITRVIVEDNIYVVILDFKTFFKITFTLLEIYRFLIIILFNYDFMFRRAYLK